MWLYPQEVISTEMITGEVIQIKRHNIVGWCHNSIHKGALNKSLLQEHDCLGKNCHFLARNCQSSFWKDLELKQKAKEKRKSNARWEKAQKYIEEDELRSLKDEWQSWLDEMGSDMLIVRLEKTPPGLFKVFYVSANRFADGNRFPGFLERVKQSYPQYRLILRHIRDVDGHFVTRVEYNARVK